MGQGNENIIKTITVAVKNVSVQETDIVNGVENKAVLKDSMNYMASE